VQRPGLPPEPRGCVLRARWRRLCDVLKLDAELVDGRLDQNERGGRVGLCHRAAIMGLFGGLSPLISICEHNAARA